MSAAVLAAGLGSLLAAGYATFPKEPPAPRPPEPVLTAGGPGERLASVLLLGRMTEAQADIPALDGVSARLMPNMLAVELSASEGLQGRIRKAAVAVALGALPGETRDTDHDGRHALLLPPPASVSWAVRLPGAARFDCEVACLLDHGSPSVATRLGVVVRDQGETARRLDVDVDACSTAKEARWQPLRIDLRELAGRVVTLELSTTLRTGSDKDGAAVLVANPRIVGREDAEQSQEPGSPGSFPNILFINIDATQAAATGIGGDPNGTTPNIDRLAAAGAFFVHAYAPSNWTRPSNLASLTGRYPSEHGLKMVMIPTLPEERRSYHLAGIVALPLLLGWHGYRAHAIVQNNLLEEILGTGVDVGFSGYQYVKDDIQHSARITAAAMAFMQQSRDERWFLYLSYNAPHFPYRPSREALARQAFARQSPLQWQRALYRSEVNLTDCYLGPLLETLANLGLDEQTLVILNSDHGEQLERHHAQEIIRESTWEADTEVRLKTSPGHETLFDEAIRVPLVLRWPGHIPAGQRIEEPVALYDLPPTVLDLIGLRPVSGTRGRSLGPALMGGRLQPRPVLVEGKSIRGVIDWPFKYIRRDGPFAWVRRDRWGAPWRRVPEEIYDLQTDPEETRDLAPERADLLSRFRSALGALTPEPRFVYFFAAHAGSSPAGAEITIRIDPAVAVDQVHLLDDTAPAGHEDAIARSAEAVEVTLRPGPGEVRRLAFTTQSAASRVTLDLVQQPADAGDDPSLSDPPRAGAMRLPMQPGPATLSDEDGYSYFDAHGDPDTAEPGLYLWRVPRIGGIKARGGKVESAVERTFRSWGYAE